MYSKNTINCISTGTYQAQQEPASRSQHIQRDQEVHLRERANENSINHDSTSTNRTLQEVTNCSQNVGTDIVGREVTNNMTQQEVKQSNHWQDPIHADYQTVGVREEMINTNN